MTISNYSRAIVAALIGGSPGAQNMGSGYIAIGSASGTLSVNTTGLQNYWDRNQFAGGSVDMSVSQEVQMLASFNSVELSGLVLRQMGLFVESSGGKAWQVENITPTTFEGTSELLIEINWRVF